MPLPENVTPAVSKARILLDALAPVAKEALSNCKAVSNAFSDAHDDQGYTLILPKMGFAASTPVDLLKEKAFEGMAGQIKRDFQALPHLKEPGIATPWALVPAVSPLDLSIGTLRKVHQRLGTLFLNPRYEAKGWAANDCHVYLTVPDGVQRATEASIKDEAIIALENMINALGGVANSSIAVELSAKELEIDDDDQDETAIFMRSVLDLLPESVKSHFATSQVPVWLVKLLGGTLCDVHLEKQDPNHSDRKLYTSSVGGVVAVVAVGCCCCYCLTIMAIVCCQ